MSGAGGADGVRGGGLRVVGAGLGRTGTQSLKVALEHLLDGPCYHMDEVFDRPADVAVWAAALDGAPPDWRRFLDGYEAAVDWPAAAFWPELCASNPAAVVVLSLRADASTWWASIDATIFAVIRRRADRAATDPWLAMMLQLLDDRFCEQWRTEHAAVAAYEAHADAVRAAVPPSRLVEWRPGDGWEPLCERLGLPVPSIPFPHTNRAADFRSKARLDQGGVPA